VIDGAALALVADAAEGSVELLVADQERVVLGRDRRFSCTLTPQVFPALRPSET